MGITFKKSRTWSSDTQILGLKPLMTIKILIYVLEHWIFLVFNAVVPNKESENHLERAFSKYTS